MKRITSLLVCLAFMGITAFAQDIQISGKVTSADDGKVLPGVSVIVKGTTTGTTTSIDGEYTLSVPSGATLVFSFVGMKAQEIAVGSQTTIDAVMEAEITGLEEVVVTALGINREKKSLGYAMQQVDGSEVNEVRETNFASSLSGKVAGVQIKQANTMGGSVNVVMRGSKSLTGNNQALFVIDGVPVSNNRNNTIDQEDGWGGYDYGNAASDINPDDVESISVLKGAAATALYGSRAANGVILVTTKKGQKKQGLGVTVNSGVVFSSIDKTTAPKHQNEYGAGYGPFYEDATGYFFEGDLGNGNQLITPTSEDASWGAKFDPNLMVVQWDGLDPTYPETFGVARPWVAPAEDYTSFFETGVRYTNNIAIDGGNDKGTFRVSYTNANETGILPNSEINKNTFNFAGTYKLTPKFTAEANVSYINNRATGRFGTGYDGNNVMQSFGQWFQVNADMSRLADYQTPDGRQRTWNYVYYDDLRPYFFDNPYWVRYKNYSNDGRDRVFGYTKLTYQFADWIRLTGRVGNDFYSEFQEERVAIGSAITGDLPRYGKRNRTFNEFNGELFLSVDKSFGDISVSGLVGLATRSNTLMMTYGETQGGLLIPDFDKLSNSVAAQFTDESLQESRVNSIFASANVGLYDLVYIDLTVRNDKSSTLPEGDNSYLYPSVSTSFVFTELDALKGNNILSFGKLRLNYAEVGNSAPVHSIYNTYFQAANYDQTGMFSVQSTSLNPELLPEKTRSYEGGLELNFLQNRVGFDFAVYKTNTFNQIMPVTISSTSGYTAVWINGGQIDNQGVELALNTVPVVAGAFRWDLDLNWFRNRNKVVELYESIDNYLLFSQWDVSVNARVGEAYGNIEGLNYVYHENGGKLVQDNGYYERTATDETLGNVNPDWNMGVSNTLSYKGVSLRFLIDIQKGGDIYSVNTKYGRATGVYAETAGVNELGVEKRIPLSENPDAGVLLEGVKADGTPNDVRVDAYRWGRAYDYNKLPTAAYVFDASYVKLRELALTYSFNQNLLSKTPFSQLAISAVGRNLWIIHKNTEHFDPEAALSAGNQQGIESGSYPTTRTFGFNLKVGF